MNKALKGFTSSNNRLDNILGNQKRFQNKKGLGFKQHTNKKSYRKVYAIKSQRNLDYIIAIIVIKEDMLSNIDLIKMKVMGLFGYCF